jgi:hypothetical protein
MALAAKSEKVREQPRPKAKADASERREEHSLGEPSKTQSYREENRGENSAGRTTLSDPITVPLDVGRVTEKKLSFVEKDNRVDERQRCACGETAEDREPFVRPSACERDRKQDPRARRREHNREPFALRHLAFPVHSHECSKTVPSR